MIKLTHKTHIKQMLKDNPNWKIVDLGCGIGGWDEANVLLDIKDHSETYKDKEFIQSDICSTPFTDKQFDFAIASHLLEHVEYPDVFLKELMRISKRGYIEVPLPMFDNLVIGNNKDHKWWILYDHVKEELLIKPKQTILPETLRMYQWDLLIDHFVESCVLQLYFEENIFYRMEEENCPISNREWKISEGVSFRLSRALNLAVSYFKKYSSKI